MPENRVAGAGDPAGGAPDSDSMSSELPFEGFGAGNGGAGSDPRVPMFAGANGARYKSMSPARLPITRSPCLTIPPGFSPTALLESPVLLTNIKAEPSPTTGTFYMHSVMKDTVGSDMLSSPRSISQISSYDEGRSSDFEFKPHIQSSSCSSFSSLGPLASTGPKLQEHLISGQAQQSHAQTLLSSQLVKADNTSHSSHELTLSATASNPSAEMNSLEAGAPGEDASDELQERKDSDTGTLALPADHNGSSTYAAGEKSAEDGYNWRKYGQKHVKGSEFPRSYYKCTHPNCQMKKQLERSHDGQVTEIIYKGKHDHPKPQPSRRLAVGTILSSQGEERFDGLSSLANAEAEKSLNAHAHVSHHIDSSGNPELSPSDDDIEVVGGRPNQNGDEVADDDDPEAKRRKMDTSATDVTLIGKTNREPRVVVQTVSEVDILDDGYRWRKYGQKVVKGNPNPRSYYKCTSVGCSVRKHVERASHDPKAVITTYEGKHNHDVPAARSTGHDSSAPMIPSSGNAHSSHVSVALSSMLRTSNTMATAHRFSHPQESNTISLDLGVGISPNHSTNTTNDKHQAPGTEQAQNCEMQQYVGHDCDQMVIQTAPMSNLYGSSSNGIYGSRADKGKDFSFGTPPIDHSSNLYYTTAGNLIMGP